MSDDDTTLNVQGLSKLLKALKQKAPRTRVGIIGAKAGPHFGSTSTGIFPTNAAIGAVHEFGSPSRGIPQRSFLRMPLTEYLNKKMESSGAFDADVMEEVLKEGTVKPWMRKIAVLAEGIVAEAFATGGFGKWPAHAPGYTNNTGNLLVDTTQLRNAITSEVR